MQGRVKHKVRSQNNIPLHSGGAARSVSAQVGSEIANDGLTNEAVKGELGRVVCQEEGGRWEGCVPGQPRQSFRHLHHPILLLANSPYLERKEGSGGC
jgi:hypothetical protein